MAYFYSCSFFHSYRCSLSQLIHSATCLVSMIGFFSHSLPVLCRPGYGSAYLSKRFGTSDFFFFFCLSLFCGSACRIRLLRGRALAWAEVVNPFLSAHRWQITEIVEFWYLTAGAGWDEEGLQIVYIKGLNGNLGRWQERAQCMSSHFPLGPPPGSHPSAFAHSCL